MQNRFQVRSRGAYNSWRKLLLSSLLALLVLLDGRRWVSSNKTEDLGSAAGASHHSRLHLLYLHVIIWNYRRAKSYSIMKTSQAVHKESIYINYCEQKSMTRPSRNTRTALFDGIKIADGQQPKHTVGISRRSKVSSFTTPLAVVRCEGVWRVSGRETERHAVSTEKHMQTQTQPLPLYLRLSVTQKLFKPLR